jgi:two-component system cell cycle response regulator DivK
VLTPRPARADSDGMASRILVIENDRESIELIDYLLLEHGYVSLLAPDGREGMRLASLVPPDLILLDIRMPGPDGYEVAAVIRWQRSLEHTRIVAVTALTSESDRARIAAAGFDGCIMKPINRRRSFRRSRCSSSSGC